MSVIKVQVHHHRELSSEQAQAILREMENEIRARPAQGGHGVHRDTRSGMRYENTFPAWAQEVLVQNGFQWEEFNLCYQRDVKDMQGAKTLIFWFDSQIRPWAAQQGYPDIDKLHIRAMEPDSDGWVERMDNY